MGTFKWIVVSALPLLLFFQSCGGGKFGPPSLPPRVPTITATPTPTPTPTLIPTVNPTSTATATKSPTPTATQTHNPVGPTSTPTNSPTNSPTSTPSLSPTATPTPTATGTWQTPTITPTPIHTATACYTVTFTKTACMAPTPPCAITGSIQYTGSGTMDSTHQLYIGSSSGNILTAYYGTGVYGGTTYTLKSSGPGVQNISVYFNFSGVPNDTSYNYVYESIVPVPGERYLTSGSCSIPAVALTIPVTFTAGTTAGPTITLDDSCSFWGIYGTVNYTGIKGTVQYCRNLYINTYLDAGYTSLQQPSAVAITNGGSYGMVTNIGSGATGLTPLYLKAWFDVNGNHVFDTGDPYIELGQFTPTTDGLLENITFGDTFIN